MDIFSRYPLYTPSYPLHYKYYQTRPTPQWQEVTSVVRAEDMDKLIPGTDLTKSQLNDKVMSQINGNVTVLDERREQAEKRRLLKKRQTVGENSLKKSVSVFRCVCVFGYVIMNANNANRRNT